MKLRIDRLCTSVPLISPLSPQLSCTIAKVHTVTWGDKEHPRGENITEDIYGLSECLPRGLNGLEQTSLKGKQMLGIQKAADQDSFFFFLIHKINMLLGKWKKIKVKIFLNKALTNCGI